MTLPDPLPDALLEVFIGDGVVTFGFTIPGDSFGIEYSWKEAEAMAHQILDGIAEKRAERN